MIGETISHYKIVEKLGSGGMGEVYKAEDTKLGRFVALKFLPQEMSRDRIAMERFLLEARAAASLSHPHICVIHEINEHEGRSFIAMEYLEGQSLKFAIAGRPMSLEIAIDVGIQVAEALAAAHNKGITHRDIKPSNLFLSKTGQTKIVDFGLAKLTPQYRASSEDETETMESGSIDPEMDLTRSGTALGTVSYMSPEQALGEEVDPRTDIFSLGAVLYEMVTGRQAFGGNTQAAIFNKLLNQPPTSPARLGVSLPFEMERIISTALEKEPGLRFQSAEEFAAALRRLKRDTESGQSVPGMTAVSREEVASMVEAEQALQEAEAAGGGEAAAAETPAAAVDTEGSTQIAIEPATLDESAAIEVEVKKRRRWVGVLAAGLIVAVGALGYMWWSQPKAPVLTESDVLLLTDFVNDTGDTVFDGTLKQALAVKLEESPFLQLASDRMVAETLGFMQLPADTAVTPEIGQEICQRQGLKALVTGEIASLGSSFVVTLSALECLSGEVLAREQFQVNTKEAVLGSLGEAAAIMRRKLGESLVSVEQFDAPVEQATTSSLEALKAFSLGAEKRKMGLEAESIPHFRRAIELDPDFAAAHARLGTVLVNLKAWDEGIAEKTRAFELVDRVSELERFYITSHYHSDVTGNLEQQIEAYGVWKDTYPRDWIAPNNLADLYSDVGWFEEAIVEAQRAHELEPDRAFPYTNMLPALLALGRYDEAGAAVDEALEKGLLHWEFFLTRFVLAYLAEDQATMEAQVEAVRGLPSELWLLNEHAAAAASGGRMVRARELMGQAVEASERHGFHEQVAYLLAAGARREASMGYIERARELALEALDVSRNRESLPVAAMALALAGATEQALQVIGELDTKNPTNTQIQDASIPIAMAAVLLAEGDPGGAIDRLRPTKPYQRRYLEALYLRGEAYLAVENPAAASAEFDQLIALRGVEATRPIHTLAHLGRARALAMTGLPDAAREAYEVFFSRVAGGDPGLPIVREARAEYRALP